MKKLLVVDDNDKYSGILMEYFSREGWECERAHSAEEGWRLYQNAKAPGYSMILTDITMESQLSGLWMIRRIHKDGFSGIKAIATTGFDVPGVMQIGRWILPWFAGISYMIPKKPLKEGRVVMVPAGKIS